MLQKSRVINPTSFRRQNPVTVLSREELKKAKFFNTKEEGVREHPTPSSLHPSLPPYLRSSFFAVSSNVSRLYLTGAFLPPPNFTAMITPLAVSSLTVLVDI